MGRIVPGVRGAFKGLRFTNRGGIRRHEVGKHVAIISHDFGLCSSMRETSSVVIILPTSTNRGGFRSRRGIGLVGPGVATRNCGVNAEKFAGCVLSTSSVIGTWKNARVVELTGKVVVSGRGAFKMLGFSTLEQRMRVRGRSNAISRRVGRHACSLGYGRRKHVVRIDVPTSIPLGRFSCGTRIRVVGPITSAITATAFRNTSIS